MEIEEIFKSISKKMYIDFEISSSCNHNVMKGDIREGALIKFLQEGRIPSKFGLSRGEIVSPYYGATKQADIVIYNKDNCPMLVYGDNINVFPIEAVYGIIEVKSTLSKKKLIESLNNIASLKSKIHPNRVTSPLGFTVKASEPFGIIFAYQLSENSLDSLLKNIKEWGIGKEKKLYPNLVVVLNEGLIYEYGEDFEYCIDTTILKARNSYHPYCTTYKERTLFEFYKLLYDQLSQMVLGDVNLSNYIEKVTKTKNGKFYVKERKLIVTNSETGEEKEINIYKEEFLEKIVTESKVIKYSDMLNGDFVDMDLSRILPKKDFDIRFYDPDNLPPFSPKHLIREGDLVTTSVLTRGQSQKIIINGKPYFVPLAYITPDVLEE